MLSTIPPEIIQDILERVDDARSFRQFRLVCRSFVQIAVPFVFRVIFIDFTANITDIVDISRHVKEAVIRLDNGTKQAFLLGFESPLAGAM